MEKNTKGLFGIGVSVLFVLLGIKLVTTSDELWRNIIGVLCLVFFGGFLLWGVYNKLKSR